MDIWENGQFGANGPISICWLEVWGNVLRCRGTGKGVGMCVGGVKAGERKCEWRCVELCGVGEERCGEVTR